MTAPVPGSSSTGLDPKLAAVLAYLFGCVSGVVLLIVERKDDYVRFHAMQSTLTFLAVLIAGLVLGSLPIVGWLLYRLASAGTFLLWLVLMFKAFTGERYKLPYVGEIAERQLR